MRSEKKLLLEEINELIDNSNAIIVAKHDKMNPSHSWQLSQMLNKAGSKFKIVKKRIFYKAAEKKDLSFKDEKYDGHIGVVFITGDSLEATKAVVSFYENNEGLINILSGQYEDGKLCQAEEIIALSKLPSKDEMRAQILGLLEAPLSQTLSTFESLITSVMHCLENKSSLEK